MSSSIRNPESQIAEEYFSELSYFLERNNEWWREAQNWNNARYGQVVNSSLESARNLFQAEILPASDVQEFQKSVSAVFEITREIGLQSKITSPTGENNDSINAIAKLTLKQLTSKQPKEVSPSPVYETSESPAYKEDSSVDTESPESSNSKESHFDVRKIQQALKELGFPIRFVDGIPGSQTTAAVREFQKSKGLIETGLVDQETYNQMMGESGAAKPSPQKQVTNLFLPKLASEGNHLATEDKLDFIYDIQSLATVISLRNVNPPLAIGLFGNWGSGKSFFMEQLSHEIQKNAESLKEEFVKHVVHVKFNSWHYSDSNLWASLITEIFDSLNVFSTKEKKEDELAKLSETLNITTAQREAVEAKRNELNNKKEKLSKENDLKRSRLEDISGIAILRLLLSDKYIRSDLKSLQNQDVEKIIQSGQKLGECLDEFSDFGAKLRYFVRTLSGMKGKRWVGVLVIYLFIFAGAITFKYLFPPFWNQISNWFTGVILTIAPILINTVRLFIPVKKEFDHAYERLKSLKETIDSHPDQGFKDMIQIDEEVKALTLTITELDKQIFDTQKEIDDLKTGRKLLEFIEQRSRDENYSKQLGLISWIRKDFSILDELLRKQHILNEKGEKPVVINPNDVKLQIDRIILYIDDLDRCKEEIVVKVLEAIHLLLAFPLFIVVVGVDPRWLNNALSEKFKNLFGKHYDGGLKGNNVMEEGTILSGAATSYDYLEKIFQIPFSLRQINPKGRKDLIEYLLSKEMKETSTDTKAVDGTGSTTTTGQNDPAGQSAKQPNAEVKKSDSTTDETDEQSIPLTFSKDEMECMQNISSIYGHSPRTINRFINIYRIIKAHRKCKVSGEFSEDDYAPIMLVLSVMVGYSDLAEDFISKLAKADDKILFTEFLKKGKFPDTFIYKILDSIKLSVAELPVKAFKDNLELISRFSFRTFAVSLD